MLKAILKTTPLIALATLFATGTASAALTVTSVDGDVASGDAPVSQHGAVAPGETVETTDDGKCSLMLDEDAVLQLCNRAEMSARPRTGGAHVLDLQRGEMKATVGKRPADSPVEIHTPAAVATILGTVVHVAVDPETGDTLITSIESRIKVTGVSGDEKAQIIDSGQQVVIKKGGDPSTPRRLNRKAMANLSDCLNDDDFRHAAVAGERAAWTQSLLDTITAMDTPAEGLPGVAAASPVAALFGLLGVNVDDLSQDVCFASQSQCDGKLSGSLPVDPNELNDLLTSGSASGCSGPSCNFSGNIPTPDPCSGVPGDQCRP